MILGAGMEKMQLITVILVVSQRKHGYSQVTVNRNSSQVVRAPRS